MMPGRCAPGAGVRLSAAPVPVTLCSVQDGVDTQGLAADREENAVGKALGENAAQAVARTEDAKQFRFFPGAMDRVYDFIG